MYSPTTRVLVVLELLQNHDELSGAELARRLEVDERTVRRYIIKLQDLGIPVRSTRGRYGAYRLTPGYKLPPMMFNDEEATALSMGLLFANQLGLSSIGVAAQSAQSKLERVMPDALKRKLHAIGETVQLDFSKASVSALSTTLLELCAVTQQHRRVSMQYCAVNGETTEREFDCYGLTWRDGRWYGVGYCHLRGGLRSFRLDRIMQMSALETTFTRPTDFDAIQYLSQAIAMVPRAHAICVRLETDIETARAALFETMGVFELSNGEVLLHSQADDLDWYARRLASLPFDFAVREPAALRQALQHCAARLQDLAAI